MSKILSAFLMILSLGIGADLAASQETTAQQDLAQYVREAKKAGLTDQQIQSVAEKAGWPARAVNGAIAADSASPQPGASETIPSNRIAASSSAATGQTASLAGQGVQSATQAFVDSAPPVKTPSPAPGVGGQPNPATPGVPGTSIKPSGPTNRGVPDDYQIGAGDVLHVNVWGEPTASVNGVVVRTDGKISLPLIHDIAVMGMTPAQAERIVTEQLSRFINNPDVAVIVGGINSKKIYVTGQVKKEGTIPYTYRMTVMQALSEAGGLTPYAKKKKIYVLRNEDGRDYQLKFDYEAVLKGEHMEMNIPLKPGDQLIVP